MSDRLTLEGKPEISAVYQVLATLLQMIAVENELAAGRDMPSDADTQNNRS
jgi:hypothetical protein